MRTDKRQSGFTLIELLVALIIVAMASAFLIIGYNQLIQRKASAQVEEVQAWLEAAADIAVLQSAVVGVTRIDNQLRLMAFFRGEWYLLAGHDPLDLDEETQITWPETSLEDAMTSSLDSDLPEPYLVLTPAGEILPDGWIELSIGTQQAEIDWRESAGFSLKWQES